MLQVVIFLSYQNQSKTVFISKYNLYRNSTSFMKRLKNLPATINPSFLTILEQQRNSTLHKYSNCWDNAVKYPFPEHVHAAFSNAHENICWNTRV